LEGAKITLNEYLDRWIQTAVKARVREKTCQDCEGTLHRYIRPSLGERILSAMRPLDVQTTYQKMVERGLSARTVRTRCVKVCVAAGIAMAPVARESCGWCQNPASAQKRNAFAVVEQAQPFLKAALRTPYGTVLPFALTTGMRPSEYSGLKWQDIDWQRQMVSVVRSLRRLDGRWCFCDTKRSRSHRPIKLQSWIVALLRHLQTKASAHDLCPEPADLVFIGTANQCRLSRQAFPINARPRWSATN
jgi:integrase